MNCVGAELIEEITAKLTNGYVTVCFMYVGSKTPLGRT